VQLLVHSNREASRDLLLAALESLKATHTIQENVVIYARE